LLNLLQRRRSGIGIHRADGTRCFGHNRRTPRFQRSILGSCVEGVFKRQSQPQALPGTISWLAIQEGPSRFAIFDTFNDEAGRDAHLNGKVAAALMEKVTKGDLFAKAPEIHRIDILADKLPH
jgi:quinol monooxygenase YgiN